MPKGRYITLPSLKPAPPPEPELMPGAMVYLAATRHGPAGVVLGRKGIKVRVRWGTDSTYVGYHLPGQLVLAPEPDDAESEKSVQSADASKAEEDNKKESPYARLLRKMDEDNKHS